MCKNWKNQPKRCLKQLWSCQPLLTKLSRATPQCLQVKSESIPGPPHWAALSRSLPPHGSSVLVGPDYMFAKTHPQFPALDILSRFTLLSELIYQNLSHRLKPSRHTCFSMAFSLAFPHCAYLILHYIMLHWEQLPFPRTDGPWLIMIWPKFFNFMMMQKQHA